MMLFDANRPLADRVRPRQLDDIVGQDHLLGEGAVLREALKNRQVPSMIFWGPPGVGKTTLAKIIGESLGLKFYQLSAVNAGVAEVRKVIAKAQGQGKVLLFLDEIHRFNKNQQDALLGAVENGSIVLIGATTENPSFEVNQALLSRCQVYVLHALGRDELEKIIHKAIEEDEWLRGKNPVFREKDVLFLYSGGDARKLLNLLELIVSQFKDGEPVLIDNELCKKILQRKMAVYDKAGEEHYNIISAFIKSMRGSDPNGAVYWLARMLEAGENIEFIARRMLILASEDIGNANPNALLLATNCFQAIQMIGMPEARIILSQTAIYLASSAKSNASYMAIEGALSSIRKTGDLPVPLHLRNAPSKLMKDLNYGGDYSYAHDYEDNFKEQEYLPDQIKGNKFYEPGDNAREKEIREFLKKRWKGKYGY